MSMKNKMKNFFYLEEEEETSAVHNPMNHSKKQ